MGNADTQLKQRKKKKKSSSAKHKMKKREKKISAAERKRRRRRARRRIVVLEWALIACVVFVLIGAGGYVVWNLPSLKLSRELSAGMEYTQEEAYDAAIEAYENALKIDSTSVEAYRCMAGAYINMQEDSQAKQILFDGWENTQDEGLLEYYCTVILNEAVAEINSDAVNAGTIEKIADVLERHALKEEAVELLGTACSRWMDAADITEFDFSSYEQIMNRLVSLSDIVGSESMREIISGFGWLGAEELKVPMGYVDSYLSILESANTWMEMPERSEMIACLHKVKEVQAEFESLFQEFDAGNYEAAKEFLVKDSYLQIRDAFINGTMQYWEGATYIPVSREYVMIKWKDGKCSFSFPNYDDNENTAGVITVWGNEMLDNGVQRSSITYEPAKDGENYYPHTEYIISYMCSNVQKETSFDYAMNYHFETRVLTEEGMTTTMIGDWGGPYQWQKTY